MGVLISSVGIYGVISFTVARQTKEIGIRMALGAKRRQILRMVLMQGIALTAVGCVLGLGIALALSRVAASLLYGISPTDTSTYIVAPVMLFAIAIVASLAPAQRAAWVDPIRSLRYE